jgi:hypothetical protein
VYSGLISWYSGLISSRTGKGKKYILWLESRHRKHIQVSKEGMWESITWSPRHNFIHSDSDKISDLTWGQLKGKEHPCPLSAPGLIFQLSASQGNRRRNALCVWYPISLFQEQSSPFLIGYPHENRKPRVTNPDLSFGDERKIWCNRENETERAKMRNWAKSKMEITL